MTSAVEHPAVLEPCAAPRRRGVPGHPRPRGRGRVGEPGGSGRCPHPGNHPRHRDARQQRGGDDRAHRRDRPPRPRARHPRPHRRGPVGRQDPGRRGRAGRRLPEPRGPQALRAEGRGRALRPLRGRRCPASCTAPATSRDAGRAPRTCSRSWASARPARSRPGTSRRTAATSRRCATASGRGCRGRSRTCGGTGSVEAGLPNTLSVGIGGVEASTLLAEIGEQLAASAGAACHAAGVELSLRPRGDARADALRDGHRSLLGGARHDGEARSTTR